MSRKKIYVGLAVIILAVVLAPTLVLGVFGDQPDTTAGGEAALASGGGIQEGIQVHGHWTIEVREPDGTVASYREFDNAFDPSTVDRVVDIFTRDRTVGMWLIWLGEPLGYTSPWSYGSGTIWESTSSDCVPPVDPQYGCDLTVTSPGDEIVLSGSITAEQNGTISEVVTQFFCCANTVAPADCVGSAELGSYFTYTTLSPFISVQSGQQILVTVEIGFS